ncbi:MAG: hypothetical protein ACUVWY_06000 [Desulfosoma sp.]|uniref:hypothetical protein n=1 Tax=Desulfosoma sp. TaxID=2603217 RepID=UPI00404A6041
MGAETVGAWAYEKLHISQILKNCGFYEPDIDQTKVLILGKRIHPASERETFQWFQHRSALEEVMDIEPKHVSLSSLYRTYDPLVAEKEKRTDRPLVTSAMILDEEGFPKTSKV